MSEEIIDALESTAPNRSAKGRIGDPTTASHADTILWRNGLLRFLDELSPDLTVMDIRHALEEFR